MAAWHNRRNADFNVTGTRPILKVEGDKLRGAKGYISDADHVPDSFTNLSQLASALKVLSELMADKISEPSLGPAFTLANDDYWSEYFFVSRAFPEILPDHTLAIRDRNYESLIGKLQQVVKILESRFASMAGLSGRVSQLVF